MRRKYTEQEKKEVLSSIQMGNSLKEIHVKHNVPMGTISRWAQKIGVSYRRDPDLLSEEIEKYLLEKKENMPLTRVAKTFRTCQNRVRMVYEKLKIESPKCRARRLRPQGICMLQGGMYPVEISQKLGVSIQTVSAWKQQISLKQSQKRHLLPEEVKQEVLRLFRKGKSLEEIRDAVKVSIPTIRKWVTGQPDVVRPSQKGEPQKGEPQKGEPVQGRSLMFF